MLGTADSLKTSLLSLPPTKDKVAGITAFVGKISIFTNQLQAGPTGSPGIFTFGDAAMISAMMSMAPVSDNSWMSKFADAWAAGVTAAIIAPGTVTSPLWLGSAVDIATLPTASATILNIAAAKASLLAGLASVGPTSDAPLPLATAIRSATLLFSFNCIGLGPPPVFAPIPVPTTAQ